MQQLEPYVALVGHLSPADAERVLGNAKWVVVLDAGRTPAALLTRAQVVQAREAGAEALLHDPKVKPKPTALATESLTLDDITRSTVMEVVDDAEGVIVLRDDDPHTIVGVLPTATILAYLSSARTRALSRSGGAAAGRLPGSPQLRRLHIVCRDCGFMNGFDALPRGPRPCQRPHAKPHPFLRG